MARTGVGAGDEEGTWGQAGNLSQVSRGELPSLHLVWRFWWLILDCYTAHFAGI